ncbi:MAG TPA: nitronate monooxygenase [Actinomycetales bacterium]|nr:nitronate monooxygenase [Actinomycetales bacterium]
MTVATHAAERAVLRRPLPKIIQGGMGIGVSSWQLAREVSQAGQLGVVSGTALDVTVARRLQDGDDGGHVRRALVHFPAPEVAERVLERFFRPGGRPAGTPYRPVTKLSLRPNQALVELAVVAAFVEVWLAKEGHDGLVGVNLLEKVQMATPFALYGAMLADVDVVLMGAGIPTDIPRLLDVLARHDAAELDVHVDGATHRHSVSFDPASLGTDVQRALRRPMFLAIVSAHVLAAYLAREDGTRPDGFVVEGPTAGGHNAPPRGRLTVDETGQPVFGPRDDADLGKVAAVGLPFWVAGGYGTPEGLATARRAGAEGVQVGTLFALTEQSGLTAEVRGELLSQMDDGTLTVRTDAAASPTGFPFKVAVLPGTAADPDVYAARPRLCDLGYLRVPFEKDDGSISYRCPAEPVEDYVRKGGKVEDTVGRKCLCNALTADIGLGQTRRDGYDEVPLVTLGADLDGARRLLERHREGWTPTDAVRFLLGS